MTFNHYAKIKRILLNYNDWYILKINEPTSAKTFSGETRHYDHYYRVIDDKGQPIPYCKFQQIDKFAKALGLNIESLVVIEN